MPERVTGWLYRRPVVMVRRRPDDLTNAGSRVAGRAGVTVMVKLCCSRIENPDSDLSGRHEREEERQLGNCVCVGICEGMAVWGGERG